MYVKNTNFAIYLGLAALVGFGASFLFSSSNSESSLLSGDISKASRYNNVKVDPATSLLEEKIQSDSAYYNQLMMTYQLLDFRVCDLEDLTARTIDVCSEIEEFKTAIRSVVSLNAKAFNTMQYINTASSSLSKISEGKKAPEYEQASSNVFVGYQKIEQQLAIGKAFVETAGDYLKNNEGEDCSAIADLVTEWAMYCRQDASINGNDEEMNYWNTKFASLVCNTPAIAESFKNKLNGTFKTDFSVGQIVAGDPGKTLGGVANYDFCCGLDEFGKLSGLDEFGKLSGLDEFGKLSGLEEFGKLGAFNFFLIPE